MADYLFKDHQPAGDVHPHPCRSVVSASIRVLFTESEERCDVLVDTFNAAAFSRFADITLRPGRFGDFLQQVYISIAAERNGEDLDTVPFPVAWSRLSTSCALRWLLLSSPSVNTTTARMR